MWQSGDAIGFISCSNGLTNNDRSREIVAALSRKLKACFGLETVMSDVIFLNEVTQQTEAPASRAGALLSLYSNASVKAIFDLSGGDLANEILPYLDFGLIQKNPKPYFGYSDNSVIVNAIQAKTGIQNVLYNPKVLVSREEAFQTLVLRDLFNSNEADWAGVFELGGNRAATQSSAVFAGGNLRCFLKLAGTPYWPELENKVLILESAGGRYEAMCSGLAQLEQLGAFDEISCLLIWQFTQMAKDGKTAAFLAVCRDYALRHGFPVWETAFIGHDDCSKPIRIG